MVVTLGSSAWRTSLVSSLWRAVFAATIARKGKAVNWHIVRISTAMYRMQ
jgi:hypothetical protein